MLKPPLMLFAAFNAALAIFASSAIAQTQPQAQEASPQKQQQAQAMPRHGTVYGYQLMTPDERTEYRNKMRTLKTWQEREQFRKEHHEQMKVRAKEKGITLPDTPPMRGHRRGMGKGMGPGMMPGMEPGQGMQGGGGPGR
jgi:hypothetical protein